MKQETELNDSQVRGINAILQKVKKRHFANQESDIIADAATEIPHTVKDIPEVSETTASHPTVEDDEGIKYYEDVEPITETIESYSRETVEEKPEKVKTAAGLSFFTKIIA